MWRDGSLEFWPARKPVTGTCACAYGCAMPIVTFHLVDQMHSEQQLEHLLRQGSQLYARVLGSPPDRIRAFVHMVPAQRVAVGGELVRDTRRAAPYFEFLMLAGRPAAQRHDLLRGFTDLLVELLEVARESVRGRAIVLDPDDWSIGGEAASVLRADEISARAAGGAV